MSEDLKKIDWLNNLENRVVRNAKPGNKNEPEAGLLLVGTDDFSDTQQIKEYLIQAYKTENFFTVADCTFVEGSKNVSTTSSFSSVEAGDFVRPAASGGPLYQVESVSTSSLTLLKEFELPTTTENCEVQSLAFGDVSYRTLENEVGATGAEFSYDSSKDRWEGEPGSVTQGPYDTNGSGSSETMADGISLNFVSEEVEGVPDMSVVGVIDKYLPTLSTDTNTVSFTPVPNPSNLTEPQDMSKLKVWLKKPADDGYMFMEFGEDYLISNTLNPMYDGYRPLSQEAKSANIHLMDSFSYQKAILDDFNGLVALEEGGNPITNIYEDSIEANLVAGSTSIGMTYKEDYLTNPDSGSTITIGYQEEESPVNQIFGFIDAFPNGLSVKKAEAGLEEATPEDFDGATVLTEGVDFAVNENSGVFVFLKQMEPGYCAKIDYLVGGSTVNEDHVTENANSLRVSHFPVMPNTVKMTAYQGVQSRSLIEGVDYKIFHSNGIILLSDSTARDTDRLTVSYAPASKITCFAKPSEDGTLDIKYENIAVQVSSAKSIKVLFPGENIRIQSLRAYDGTEIDSSKAKGLGNGIYDLGSESKKMAEQNYAYASILAKSDKLAYAPVVRIRKRIPANQSEVVIENIGLGSLPVEAGDMLLFRSSQDPSFREFSWVDEVADLDGVNSKITLTNPLSVELVFPLMYFTDGSVNFNNLDSETVVRDFGRGADSLVIEREDELDLVVGHLINLKGAQIVSVTGVQTEGDVHTVSISPSTRVSSDSLSSTNEYGVTDKPVYLEGDNGIITKKPMVSFEAPVASLYEDHSSSVEVRYSVDIRNDKIKITKREELQEDEVSEITISSHENLKQVLDQIVSETGGDLRYTEIRDTSKVAPGSIANTVSSFNPKQVPMDIKAYPSVYRSEGGGAYIELDRGGSPGEGDYAIVGGFIQLSDPLEQGQRFKVTYTYSDSMPEKQGYTFSISGKRFVPFPEGSSIRVSLDYLSKDQHMIQSLSESGFLSQYVYPYIEEQKKAKKGSKPQGSRGVEAPPSSGVAQGGVYNNFMQLRDHWISSKLLWKISDFYKYRMGSFSAEMEAVDGHRFGNNDFKQDDWELDRMSRYEDVEQQASFGESVFYPANYKKNNPKPDGRFYTEYLAYDQVYLYNTGGKGRLYGLHSDFGEGFRDIEVGDRIQIVGRADLYTVQSLNSSEIVLEEEIEGAPSSLPTDIEEGGGGFYGNSYKVIREGRSFSYVDDRGGAGCVAISPRESDYFAFGEEEFKIEKSLDGGVTWSTSTYTINVASIPVPSFLSIGELARALYDKMKDDFIVRVETVYKFPKMSSEVSKSLDISWPLPIPDLDDVPSRRSAIVIRGRSPNMWVRFNQVGDINLGFPVNKVYESNYNPDNCSDNAAGELSSKNSELSSLEDIYEYSDKLMRGSTGPRDTLIPLVSDSYGSTNKHLASLGEAFTASQEIKGETGFEQAWQEADHAAYQYDAFATNTTQSLNEDNYQSSIVNSPNINFLINDVQERVLGKVEADTELHNNRVSSGVPFVEFQAGSSNDSRILFGDKSEDPSVPIGPNYSLFNVFPQYDLGTTQPQYPVGYWDTNPETLYYSSGNSYKFYMHKVGNIISTVPGAAVSLNEYQMVLTSGVNSYTLNYGSYANILLLKSAIDALPGFTLNITYSDAYEGFGTLMKTPSPVNVFGTGYDIYFGVRGAMKYYSLSDLVFDNRIYQLSQRISALGAYSSFYTQRKEQLEGSFSSDGENLAANRQKWLNYNLQRVYGPSNLVLPLKRNIAED